MTALRMRARDFLTEEQLVQVRRRSTWKGAALTYWVFALGLMGLIVVILAVTNLFRFLFPLWCLLVAILLIRGYFLSSYVFAGAGQFRFAVWLTIGALVALVASLTLLPPRRRKAY